MSNVPSWIVPALAETWPRLTVDYVRYTGDDELLPLFGNPLERVEFEGHVYIRQFFPGFVNAQGQEQGRQKRQKKSDIRPGRLIIYETIPEHPQGKCKVVDLVEADGGPMDCNTYDRRVKEGMAARYDAYAAVREKVLAVKRKKVAEERERRYTKDVKIKDHFGIGTGKLVQRESGLLVPEGAV